MSLPIGEKMLTTFIYRKKSILVFQLLPEFGFGRRTAKSKIFNHSTLEIVHFFIP
jgi:hypothetical protein